MAAERERETSTGPRSFERGGFALVLVARFVISRLQQGRAPLSAEVVCGGWG